MANQRERVEGLLTGVGNIRLFWQGWLPQGNPTGVVLFCHGGAEHSGRYGNLVDALIRDGWAVYGLDMRGHGQSGGPRMHAERFSDWLDDFDTFRRHVLSGHTGLPVFLLGQGVGAQIALAYALGHQQLFRGLVLSAPLLEVISVPKAARPLAKVAARLTPHTRIGFVDFGKISKDPAVVAQHQEDPLVHHGAATLRYSTIVSAQFTELPERARALRLPLLIQHGTEDKVAAPAGTHRLEMASGSRDQTMFWYQGLWHEIYNEPERERPLGDLREWLAAHR